MKKIYEIFQNSYESYFDVAQIIHRDPPLLVSLAGVLQAWWK